MVLDAHVTVNVVLVDPDEGVTLTGTSTVPVMVEGDGSIEVYG
jgi:hypothetical protein